MLNHLTYFLILLLPGIIFNITVWSLWWRKLRPRVRTIAATILVVSLYWGAIDFIAINHLGIWSFRPDHTTGFMLFGIPAEEWQLFTLSGGFLVPLILIFVGGSKKQSRSEALLTD